MRYFITGASGWIGSAVSRELIAHGHQVVGLARSDASATLIESLGARVVRGELTDLDVLRAAAADADGVVHLGFIHDFSDFAGSVAVDQAAIGAIGGVVRPGGVLAIASGVAGLTPGRIAKEADVVADEGRGRSAHLALGFADRGVLPLQLRFAPSVHGIGDHGFIAAIARIAREHGVSAYIGDGSHRWAAVHRDDAARLVRLALESPARSTVVHAVAEEGVATRAIAEALGARLGLPVTSVAPDAADAHFGWMARFFGSDLAASSDLTRERYDWHPTGPTLVEDIASGGYDEGAVAA